MALDVSVRHGRVRGRYFRENFAQGGIDLVQIVPELVTNADDAITSSGRGRGRIELSFGPPEPELVRSWRQTVRAIGVPALESWKLELCCTDNGEGIDAATIDERLGALGVMPTSSGRRGLFGRGLRDVWLAQGGGRIEGVRNGRMVESWFFPAGGDEPYAYAHIRDEPASSASSRELGLDGSGTRVTVPLAIARLPQAGRLRTLVAQLVQLRPILEDSTRELWLALPGEQSQSVVYPQPEPDPERPVLFDEVVDVAPGVTARVIVRRAAEPFTLGPSRATRLGGLVIRSGRSAHEATLAGYEGRPGARHIYGEVWCEALERLQREALDKPRPQVVVRVDRSGLNEHHAIVRKLYAAIDGVLRPIVADEERRAGAHLVAPGRAIKARDQQGLRALNDVLRTAFESPGAAGFTSGDRPGERAAATQDNGARELEAPRSPDGLGSGERHEEPALQPMHFRHSPIRLHPGARRRVSLIFDPACVPPGASVTAVADDGLRVTLAGEVVPPPGARGWSRLAAQVRARVSTEPGSRLTVLAEAGEYAAELEVLVVRHTAGGWVREIARKDEDATVEAHFDPESGVVTVFEGRREFKALERAARRGGIPRRRVREYLPYRLLEVEVAANAVYAWAAEQVLERRLAEERPLDPAEYGHALRLEAQTLRHRSHERLMRAFLDPEVFEGRVRVDESPAGSPAQASLLSD